MGNVELLAPAGNKEAFFGAVCAGADAVYLGGDRFGARAYADNFHTEELIFCIRYAHMRGCRVYLTVNTLMKERELEELYDYLSPVYEAGLDGVIVQDIGAFLCVKRWFPELELHVSTQMTVTGVHGARLLQRLGAVRVVPARELSLAELQAIKSETGLELEAFIHGAMCYCYSGQCLFSSMLGGRSGNRGRCAQPCRLSYRVTIGGKTSKECYPLSLKDLCTIEQIGELMDKGIDSFKIEGRMKKAEYAAGVTAVYRKYIDLKLARPDGKLKINQADLSRLSGLYIRSGRQNGYYKQYNGAGMITLDSPAYSGSDEKLLREIREQYIEHNEELPVSIYAYFHCGEKAFVTFMCGEQAVTVEGAAAEPAQKSPVRAAEIEKQLKKLGDTGFFAENITVDTDEKGFLALREINTMRRAAVTALGDAIIEAAGLPAHRPPAPRETQKITEDCCGNPQITDRKMRVLVSTLQQLSSVREYVASQKDECKLDRVYLESELLQMPELEEALLPLQRQLQVYAALPFIMRAKDEPYILRLLELVKQYRLTGCLIRNLEEYAFLTDTGFQGKLSLDASVYQWNRETIRFWKDSGADTLCCPIELSRREWMPLFSDYEAEKLAYGHLPMMVTANCVAKTTAQCLRDKSCNTKEAFLTDRYRKKLPVALHCSYCTNVIFNAVPLSLHKDISGWPANIRPRLSFTSENAEEAAALLTYYGRALLGNVGEFPCGEYTTGHEKNGVE